MAPGPTLAIGCLWFLFLCSVSVEIKLSVVSWNVNGAAKFSYLPAEREFLRSHDVVFLQETFSRENTLLDLAGFCSHHVMARRSTGTKTFWGLSTFLKTSKFVDGYIKREFSPCDWILISRWMRGAARPGIIFFNVYIPVHTNGFTPGEVSTLTQCAMDMLQRFPGDKFVFGGDFNLDRLRFHSQRFKPPALKYVRRLLWSWSLPYINLDININACSVSRAVDEAFGVFEALDFQQYPRDHVATYYAADGSPSSLDYFFTDQSIRTSGLGVPHHHFQFQHLAIRMELEFLFNDQSGDCQ